MKIPSAAAILLFHAMTTPAFADDPRVSSRYITASCAQMEVQIEDNARYSRDFNLRHAERYRLEIVQTDRVPQVFESRGNIVSNILVEGSISSFRITVYDTAVDPVNPQFTVDARGWQSGVAELHLAGKNESGILDGSIWLRSGPAPSFISVNGVDTRFTCEITMRDRSE